MIGSFNTPEDMDDLRAALKTSINLHDEMVVKVQRQIAAEIEDWCRRARDKGMNVAISPLYSSEPKSMYRLDDECDHVFSVKHDAMLLKPGEPPPAGWTLYEVAK